MKAISVRAPWWWAILHVGKDIENRDWPTHFRGTVLLHASKWFSLNQVVEDAKTAVRIYEESEFSTHASCAFRQMRDVGGHIVGKVDVVDCVSSSDSPWFFGKYGFVLRNPVAFETPIPLKGALGFFDVPDELVANL